MTPTPSPQIPRAGMFATVRNRRGVVSAVEPFDGERGRLHLVHLEYKDDQLPAEEQLLWELEPRERASRADGAARTPLATDPMPAEDFDALLRAARWTAAMPFLDPDGTGPLDRLPISSPFHGAVQVEDFQLVPLLKALRMPRVNLLIADDVGLGKTIEAGLILSELLLRRRIQRVLILTPASLRLQWRDEMWDKFSLPLRPRRPRRDRTRCAAAWAWTPTPGAPSAASSPPTTTCGRTTCSSSSSRPAARRRARRTCRGTC